MNDVLLN